MHHEHGPGCGHWEELSHQEQHRIAEVMGGCACGSAIIHEEHLPGSLHPEASHISGEHGDMAEDFVYESHHHAHEEDSPHGHEHDYTNKEYAHRREWHENTHSDAEIHARTSITEIFRPDEAKQDIRTTVSEIAARQQEEEQIRNISLIEQTFADRIVAQSGPPAEAKTARQQSDEVIAVPMEARNEKAVEAPQIEHVMTERQYDQPLVAITQEAFTEPETEPIRGGAPASTHLTTEAAIDLANSIVESPAPLSPEIEIERDELSELTELESPEPVEDGEIYSNALQAMTIGLQGNMPVEPTETSPILEDAKPQMIVPTDKAPARETSPQLLEAEDTVAAPDSRGEKPELLSGENKAEVQQFIEALEDQVTLLQKRQTPLSVELRERIISIRSYLEPAERLELLDTLQTEDLPVALAMLERLLEQMRAGKFRENNPLAILQTPTYTAGRHLGQLVLALLRQLSLDQSIRSAA